MGWTTLSFLVKVGKPSVGTVCMTHPQMILGNSDLCPPRVLAASICLLSKLPLEGAKNVAAIALKVGLIAVARKTVGPLPMKASAPIIRIAQMEKIQVVYFIISVVCALIIIFLL